MLEGMCEREWFLSLVRDFVVLEGGGSGKLAKKMAGHHQFHAVEAAVEETPCATALRQELRWVAEPGTGARTADQRAAVPATGASESSGTPKACPAGFQAISGTP